ncbi:MAG: hypothetical protein RI935_602 [Candidatus Parcubacteria bacterium]|jgi:hypothetical protein
MRRSSPTVESVEVARVWDATVEPLSEVIVPPTPPASTPQVNVPLDQRSFSVDVLHAVKLAPKSDARVRPPVEDAFRKERPLVVREDAVVVASVDVPSTLKRPDVERLVVDALVKVVFPVTLSVEEKDPVVPMSDP